MKRHRLLPLFAVVFLLGAASAAPAPDLHLRLVRSEPARDTTVSKSPEAVHLWFSEEPQVRLTTVQLTGGDGRTIDLEKPVVAGDDAKHVAASVPRTLPPGSWTVSWRTLARDGHVVRGEFAFRIEVVE